MARGPAAPQVDVAELVKLCAVDGLLMYRTFFPKTVRTDFALYHREASDLLDSTHRLVNIQLPRDGAKTSFLRMYTAKRVAFNLSRTILYIGASEGHALRSVNWLKRQIEFNRFYADTFKLRRGGTWQDGLIEIIHGVEGNPIWVIGVGITGSTRGINFDDYRPDLIVADDVITDENAATEEQREKHTSLLLGAVRQSLAPASENPDAKMAMLQTPLNAEDASCRATRSVEWTSLVRGCWTEDTKDLPLEQQKSSWPARFSDETMRAEKAAAIHDNVYSIFAREKECKLVRRESAAFYTSWLKYWDDPAAPHQKPQGKGVVVITVDPVPPPTPDTVKKDKVDNDFEAIVATMRLNGKYYLLGYRTNRGHDTVWTCETVHEFIQLFQPMSVVVEMLGFQTVIGQALIAYLRRRGCFTPVKPVPSKYAQKNKYAKITGMLSGVASSGLYYISLSHTQFKADFEVYPGVDHDDLLDACAMGVHALQNPYLETTDVGSFFQQDVKSDFDKKLKLKRKI